NAGREVVLVDDRVAGEVEGEEPRLPAPVPGEIERPEPTLAIDADGERRVEPGLLRGLVGIRDRLPAHQLDELDRRGAARVQREEHAPRGRHGDVGGRVIEGGDHLEDGGGEGGGGRAVLRAPAPANGEGAEDEGKGT